MAVNQDILRSLPKVDEVLSNPLLADHPHTIAVEAVRTVLQQWREAVLDGSCSQPPSDEQIARLTLSLMEREQVPSLRKVINATGVILHTNLGRSPLPKQALAAVCAISGGYSSLEYSVEEGARGNRHVHATKTLQRLTDCEDALVVNNNAAAVLLILSALAKNREVVVSRSELIEIGGAFRIPDVMEQAGCILREVGTTNRTRLSDYEKVLDPQITGAIFKAHPSNYSIVGFTEEAPLSGLVSLGMKHALPVIYDLGSGALLDLKPLGIGDCPTVQDCLQAGVDIVCFSGDKLLGGPQAGIIAGKKEYISRMRRHPLARALRIDKLSLAALDATLRLYLDPAQPALHIPTITMLHQSVDQLRDRAEELMRMLVPVSNQIQLVKTESQIGGGSVPGQTLPTIAVEITPGRKRVGELEKMLRDWDPPIIARISRERLLLDIRTLEDCEFPCVAQCLETVLRENL